MDITCYLPDEVGQRAKAAELPFSQLLRAAVTEELYRRNAVAQTIEEAEVHQLDLQDNDGRPYIGRLTGTRIGDAGGYNGNITVFLADDERVIVYDDERLELHELTDPESELRAWLPDFGNYLDAMHDLGLTPEIDI